MAVKRTNPVPPCGYAVPFTSCRMLRTAMERCPWRRAASLSQPDQRPARDVHLDSPLALGLSHPWEPSVSSLELQKLHSSVSSRDDPTRTTAPDGSRNESPALCTAAYQRPASSQALSADSQ
ncbi:hypothetical protein NN561_000737 [Cricetulus griseus]